MENNKEEKISGLVLIALHLVPGLLFAGVFLVLSRIFIQNGLTAYLALLITIPACLVPVELGMILLFRAKSTEKRSLSEMIGYCRHGTAAEYVMLPFFLFLFCGALSIAVKPLSQYIETHLPAWLPAWATQEALVQGLVACSPAQRTITLGLAVLISGFVAPVVEEIYFRGFLLPRMERWGWAAPVVNALLFAAYHFYFPGNVPHIFVAFLPISYFVMVRKNWRIGLIVHSAFNLMGVFSLFT
ncbi:MAG: CPBP family intramembrane glutamic endopeptidase [Planctomycetota bacterium]